LSFNFALGQFEIVDKPDFKLNNLQHLRLAIISQAQNNVKGFTKILQSSALHEGHLFLSSLAQFLVAKPSIQLLIENIGYVIDKYAITTGDQVMNYFTSGGLTNDLKEVMDHFDKQDGVRFIQSAYINALGTYIKQYISNRILNQITSIIEQSKSCLVKELQGLISTKPELSDIKARLPDNMLSSLILLDSSSFLSSSTIASFTTGFSSSIITSISLSASFAVILGVAFGVLSMLYLLTLIAWDRQTVRNSISKKIEDTILANPKETIKEYEKVKQHITSEHSSMVDTWMHSQASSPAIVMLIKQYLQYRPTKNQWQT